MILDAQQEVPVLVQLHAPDGQDGIPCVSVLAQLLLVRLVHLAD